MYNDRIIEEINEGVKEDHAGHIVGNMRKSFKKHYGTAAPETVAQRVASDVLDLIGEFESAYYNLEEQLTGHEIRNFVYEKVSEKYGQIAQEEERRSIWAQNPADVPIQSYSKYGARMLTPD